MTSENRGYYEILGVSEDADFEEIRASFWERAREFHPDRNPSPDAAERMQEINEAYEVLRDDEQRRTYDRAHRTFSATQQELDRAFDIAIGALGELAFELGRKTGAGVVDEWSFLRIGSVDVPGGFWPAILEAALESALEDGNLSAANTAVCEAAWRCANSEAARLVGRHALFERSSTVAEAQARDLTALMIGAYASATGRRLGEERSEERVGAGAWRDVYSASFRTALTAFQDYARNPGYTGVVDDQTYSSIADLVATSVTAALNPHIAALSMRRRAVAGGQPVGTMIRPSGGGEVGMGCGLLLVFLGGLISLLTYQAAARAGGTYYVFFGVVGVGGFVFLRGWLAATPACKIAGAVMMGALLLIGYGIFSVFGFTDFWS